MHLKGRASYISCQNLQNVKRVKNPANCKNRNVQGFAEFDLVGVHANVQALMLKLADVMSDEYNNFRMNIS